MSAEQQVKRLCRKAARNFVILPEPLPLPADLKKLIKSFPQLTFILWTGEELFDLESEDVVCLKPPVDLVTEEQQMFSYDDAIDEIRNHSDI